MLPRNVGQRQQYLAKPLVPNPATFRASGKLVPKSMYANVQTRYLTGMSDLNLLNLTSSITLAIQVSSTRDPALETTQMDRHIPDPLWQVVGRHFDVKATEPEFTPVFGRLYLLASAMGLYDETFSRRFAIDGTAPIQLYPAQEKSFRLIWHWWTEYGPWFRQQSSDTGEGFLESINGVPHVLRIEHSPSMEIISLLERELAQNERVSITPSGVELMRLDAALCFACRALALPSYFETLASGSVKDLRPLQSQMPIIPPAYTRHSGPKILHETELPGSDPRCLSGVNANPCPWLPKSEGLPFYLWDRHSKQTIQVSSLISRPVYTAISHTWGRWEKMERGRVKMTVVPGVGGWEVPENTIFDVKSLPTLLSKVPSSTRFVWFDLICIPQDHSPKARDEIARQAEIFRNASHSIIWLNKLQSWEGLRSTIAWMSLVYLNVDPDPFWKVPRDNPSLNQNGNFTGLFEPYNFSSDTLRKDMTICSWFDSLWTLQEVCLRPDMWLCNCDWELLTTGVERIPVAMNALIALTHACTTEHTMRIGSLGPEDFAGHPLKPSFEPSKAHVTPDKMFGSLVKYGCSTQDSWSYLSSLTDQV